ncbi:glycerol-3-phosphate dehydrogenase, partial [Staphylococcus pseudintermedius]
MGGLVDVSVEIKGILVVTAAGPGGVADRIADVDKNKKPLRLTNGVHVVIVRSKIPLRQAVYFDAVTDGRMVLAIPSEGKAYVGTAET